MRFIGTDQYVHGSVGRPAVLLLNLGTPQAPTAPAVRRYLREFLSDPRVVELPRWLWWPILNGPVLALRPRRSAAKYAAVWTAEGSPLLVGSQHQATALGVELALRGRQIDVVLAMRYGQPSIESAMQQLRARHVTRVLMLPLYPQYSATTTASAIDGVNRVVSRLRDVPEIRWIKHFADDPGYIDALRASVIGHWERQGRGECLLMSFHGLPRRNLDLGDPYHCECQKTARLLAAALGLGPSAYRVSFQSRFGRARWLEPSTVDTLDALARGGVRRLDVICPGFVADCLETLEEIAIEGRAQFLAASGQQLRYIPCLNDSPAFIRALADLVERNTQGWPVDPAQQDRQSTEALRGAELAIAMGAPR
ncbi:MAG TPA: ferrochelatase [Burkholderiaceae bacterium]|jgi:ferrochelatase|nr:ferrochelatase [Burkholderiaceae bacterium]